MTTAPTIVIRPGRAEDAAIIARYNQAMALETEVKTLDPATLRRGVEIALSSPQLCRYFLAEVGGDVAGQVMVTYEWSDWRAGMIWWLQSVYVAPQHRRKGVFRALFRHVEAEAREGGMANGGRRRGEGAGEGDQRPSPQPSPSEGRGGRAAEVCGLRLYVERHNRRAMQTYQNLGMGDAGYVVFEKMWGGRE
jgi:GNAT superfamily N-acetyltransferase